MKKILCFTGPASVLAMTATLILIISKRFDAAFIAAIISLAVSCLRYLDAKSNKKALPFNIFITVLLIAALWMLK